MLVPAVSIGVFLAVCLAVLAWASTRERALGARLEPYGYGQRMPEEEELARPFSERAIVPAVRALNTRMMSVTPQRLLRRTSERLAMAGLSPRLRAGWFLLISAAFMAGLPLFYVAIMAAAGQSFGFVGVAILVLLAFFGSRVPDIWLGFRIDSRQRQIQRSLPDALDLITVCVEAGMALDAALNRVADTSRGPLAGEVRQAVRELSLGKPRRDALRDMARRTGVADLVAFVAAVVQAQETGVSVTAVLRVQSDALRVKRRQRAEELATKAPLKMLFPLMVCILPATFVVILGPAAVSIWQNIIND